MSNVAVLIEALESKIKMIENSIAQAASHVKQWTDNHHGLTGMLQGTREALEDAKKLVDEVAPDSKIDELLNEIETGANVVENVADNLESAS